MPRFVSLYSFAFFIGAVTSPLHDKLKNNDRIQKISSVSGYPLVALLFLNLPVLREKYGLVYGDSSYFRIWCDPVTWVLVYSLFICAILNSKSLAFLNHRFFVYLGSISYGFYLVHYPVLVYVKELKTNSLVQLILAFIISAVVAHLSYKFYEKPMRRKIRCLAQ